MPAPAPCLRSRNRGQPQPDRLGLPAPDERTTRCTSRTFPASASCVLVGPPVCGKSTLAARWPDSWRMCPDRCHELATDDFLCQVQGVELR